MPKPNSNLRMFGSGGDTDRHDKDSEKFVEKKTANEMEQEKDTRDPAIKAQHSQYIYQTITKGTNPTSEKNNDYSGPRFGHHE